MKCHHVDQNCRRLILRFAGVRSQESRTRVSVFGALQKYTGMETKRQHVRKFSWEIRCCLKHCTIRLYNVTSWVTNYSLILAQNFSVKLSDFICEIWRENSRTISKWRTHGCKCISGCFSLCQSDQSQTSGNTRGKWNDIFRSNRTDQKERLLLFLFLFRIPYITEEKWAMSRIVKIEQQISVGIFRSKGTKTDLSI